jgi:hypothetical protein
MSNTALISLQLGGETFIEKTILITSFLERRIFSWTTLLLWEVLNSFSTGKDLN